MMYINFLNIPDSAKVHINKVLRIDPLNSDANFNYGDFFGKFYNLADSAKKYYEIALKTTPENSQLLIRYATALKILNNTALAKQVYLKAIHLDPKLETKFRDNVFFDPEIKITKFNLLWN